MKLLYLLSVRDYYLVHSNLLFLIKYYVLL